VIRRRVAQVLTASVGLAFLSGCGATADQAPPLQATASATGCASGQGYQHATLGYRLCYPNGWTSRDYTAEPGSGGALSVVAFGPPSAVPTHVPGQTEFQPPVEVRVVAGLKGPLETSLAQTNQVTQAQVAEAQSAAAAFCILAVIAVLGLARKAQEVLRPAVGTDHAAVVRYAILLTGGTVVLLMTLDLSGVPVGQLVLGGAVTGILVGIAGQQTLANVFAGLVLLLSRPFGVGDLIRLRSGALGGQLEGTVTEIGITYMRLETPDGVLHVPNAQVLAAAAGPIPNPAQAGTVQPAQASTTGRPVPPTGGSGSAGPSTGSAGPPDGGQPPGVP